MLRAAREILMPVQIRPVEEPVEKGSHMFLGLGIDTGGTYTDAVIYDFEKGSIEASAKSVTDKNNLVESITNALDGLPEGFYENIKAVSLSTTLATNACVEGKGGRSKLILIGCDEKIVRLYGAEYGLPDFEDIIFLKGGHDQKGNVISEPDWDHLHNEVEKCRHRTDSFAVVEIWGMNNSDFEKKTKMLIRDRTGGNVVCGHELTAKINLLKRAASALLNAQLIPLITGFLEAIKKSLISRGINAPIAIVRGDGSLMQESFAAEHPVETVLCGPAASVEGGINLTGEKNCIVVDMGGTTSDMAIVKDHMPKLADEGAVVGKWRTGTHSMMIDTIGLGGDSRISFDRNANLVIGPERSMPICMAASKWPVIKECLNRILKEKRKYYFPLCEFMYISGDMDNRENYNTAETELLEMLKSGPIDIETLTRKFGDTTMARFEEGLYKQGMIMRIGLTPTDLMHVNGDFVKFDADAASAGAGCLANQVDMTVSRLIALVYGNLRERLFLNIAKVLIEDEDQSLIKEGMNSQLTDVLLNGFRKAMDVENGNGHAFLNTFNTGYTLVGIGAPVHVFLPEVAKAMGTGCVIPEYAHVANAAGAITANIRTVKTVRIVPEYTPSGISGYNLFSQKGGSCFKDYEEALNAAARKAEEEAAESARARGAYSISVKVEIYENKADVPIAFAEGFEPEDRDDKTPETDSFLVETLVTATALGKPAWEGIKTS